MEDLIGILLIYPSPKPYLEEELVKRQFKLFRLWEIPPASQRDFLRSNSQSIRAIIGNASVGPDAEMIDLLPKLEIVASHSVGLDQVDLKKCREREIMVVNTPDVLTDDVADLAIGLAIATLRQICAADRHVRSGSWMIKGDYRLTAKFSGKAVGIVGLGRIGLAVARRAEAFGCPIGYYSRSEKPETGYKYYSSVAELAGSSQVLVLACALTVETRHAISREIIEALGPSGVLVNVGRGELVDETELVSALVEGRLGGAGLDVFEREPFEPPQELMALGNVVMLPHVGSGTWETRKVMADLLVANLEAHVLRKPLLTPVL